MYQCLETFPITRIVQQTDIASFLRRGMFLTFVLKRDVLLAWLVKLAHKPALTYGDKTNLFPRNISHTTLVSTQNRKLSANIKMFLKQIKQKSALIKHFRYSVPNPQYYGVIVSVACLQLLNRSIWLT